MVAFSFGFRKFAANSMGTLMNYGLVVGFIALSLTSDVAGAACIDVSQSSALTFEGMLTYHIFAGPPNFEDVRRGDAPEPSYILKLDDPICATGDDFVDPQQAIDRIHIFPEYSLADDVTLSKDLRRFVGQRVLVEGKSAFGAHT